MNEECDILTSFLTSYKIQGKQKKAYINMTFGGRIKIWPELCICGNFKRLTE